MPSSLNPRPPRTFRWATPLLGLAMLFFAACPPRGLAFGPEGYLTDPAKMLALLDAHDRRFLSLKGQAKLKVSSPEQNGSVDQYLSVLRPALLHIETFNFFGKTVSSLVSDGAHFSLYDGEHNTFYQGPATPQVVGRFLPLALPPEAAVALILGEVPRISPESSTLLLDEPRRRYVLELKRGEVTQTLEIATDDQRVLRSHATGQGGFDLELDDYHPEPAGPFPHRITLTASAQSIELTYRYTDIEVNGAADLSLFQQEPPSSSPVTELDASGNAIGNAALPPDAGSPLDASSTGR